MGSLDQDQPVEAVLIRDQITKHILEIVAVRPGIRRADAKKMIVGLGFTSKYTMEVINDLVDDDFLSIASMAKRDCSLYLAEDKPVQRRVPAMFNGPAMCGPRRDTMGWSVNFLQSA